MRIRKSSKVIIIYVSKKQLKHLFLYEIIIGSIGYWMFKFDDDFFSEVTGFTGSMILPLIAKKVNPKKAY
ncbi:hypothetical protein [Priestia filamentosa]|uniref:hypothetical protein n=1 Tax=Priestia filamentosa TaxID=1402861 RepID=UPI000E7704D1|nr:hypothetical protein [Priestia filamentosa]RJS63120.1 hypothetical protein CJ485_23235 [Priestia filamentosa]